MRKSFMLFAVAASTMIVSCSKKDDDSKTPTPTPTPKSTEATLDSTEKIMLGKWIVDRRTDSSVTMFNGKKEPWVTESSVDDRFMELKSTRLNFMVGTDLKHKDVVDGLYNVGLQHYWFYDASTNILHLIDDHHVLRLTKDSMVIRYVLSDDFGSTDENYHCLTSYLHKE